jgi:outer membrane lipoprotein-sorting protein
MPNILTLPIVIVVMLLSCGCAATNTSRLVYQSGAVLNTFSAAASLSISKGEQGMGSNGYLLYHRPDRMRMVILSPFGTTLMELYVNGDSITIVDTSLGTAFSGLLDDLPRTGDGAAWQHVRWILEMDRPENMIRTGELERDSRSGIKERVTVENGLIVSKVRSNGDMVRYNDYIVVNGVPLASEIIVDSHDGGRFRVKLSEPEVNVKLDPEAFVPKLDGLKIYPLAVLRGQ